MNRRDFIKQMVCAGRRIVVYESEIFLSLPERCFKGVLSRNSPRTLKTLTPDKDFANYVFGLKTDIFLDSI